MAKTGLVAAVAACDGTVGPPDAAASSPFPDDVGDGLAESLLELLHAAATSPIITTRTARRRSLGLRLRDGIDEGPFRLMQLAPS